MSSLHFMSGGSGISALVRAHPWASTPLGAPEGWPAALKTIVQVMLASTQPMFVVWGNGRTFLYNDAYSEILGLKHPDALGRDFLEVWHEVADDIGPLVARAYAGEPVQMDDIALVLERHGYPEEAHFSFSYSPIRADDGSVAGFFCAVNERTGEVLAQRAVRASEARYRDVLSKMDEGFLLLDKDFRVADANDYAAHLSGRSREEMVGRNHWELYPGSQELEIGRLYIRAMRDRVPGTLEHLYRWPTGRQTWIDVRAYPTDEGVAIFFRDVTARHEVERIAAESAQRVQLALDAGAIVGTWVWDVRADRFVADERFARAFGQDAEQCRTGLPLARMYESIHPDDRERVGLAVKEVLGRGGLYRCQYRVRREDGQFHHIEAVGTCELDESRQPRRFPGVLLDIEDRFQIERERDRANAMLRTFIEAVPGVVYAKDRQGRLMLANKGTAELIGKPAAFFTGKTDAELLEDKKQAAIVMANDRRVMDSGVAEQIEELVPLPDGTPMYWLSTKAPLRDAEGAVVGLVGTSVDITERKREQERARLEAETLDLLNQTAELLAGELDLDALLQNVTDAATKLTGARFGAFFYNGTDAHGEAYMLYTLSGAPRSAFEKFGHPRPTPIFEPTFRGGPPIRLDDVQKYPLYGKWGPHHGMPAGHLPVRSYLAVPVVSRSGDVIGGLFFGHPEPGVFSERSERLAAGIASQAAVAVDNARLYAQAQRAAEERTALLESERAARAEAERANKLKDEFLATLSHELRTPLSAIMGWAHILRRKAGDDPALAKGAEVIERSTRVQTQLIEDLLDMSRIASGKLQLDLQPVDPLAFVQAAVDSVAMQAEPANVRLVVTAAQPRSAVLADAARMQQVVWNLLSNAIKFTPGGGDVSVALASNDGHVTIEVRDWGVGIAPEFLPHVFDPFRQADGSTKRRFGGLGLGLSIVRQITELHGGTVSASSDGEGRGACFLVQLPTEHVTPLRKASAPIGSIDVDLDGLQIVVVDDEPDVLDLLSRVLGEARAEVLAYRAGPEALKAVAERRPNLLISDIGMAGMDGYELLKCVRRLQDESVAKVPAIALTAFARPEDRKRALDAGFDLYLSKPIAPQALLREVSRVCRDAGAGSAKPRRTRPT